MKPRNKKELLKIIKEEIKKQGNNADLNHIDVSNVKDMSFLFYHSDFNGDISQWDVSNVKYMVEMFRESKFDNDISKWNVSNVVNMEGMFMDSEFSCWGGDLSNWDTSNVWNMSSMFYNCGVEICDVVFWVREGKWKLPVDDLWNNFGVGIAAESLFEEPESEEEIDYDEYYGGGTYLGW